MLNCVWNMFCSTGTVCSAGSEMISEGIMKSFHDWMKAKIPTVAHIGPSSGRIRRQNTRQVPAPSIRIDSSSSSGMVRRNAVNSSVLNAIAKATCRIATPRGLSSPRIPVSWICGSATTGNGMNIAASR